MSVSDLSFSAGSDFNTREHRVLRIDGWMGGAFVELPYFLSCLTQKNFMATSREKWEPALQRFISKKLPTAKWIFRSKCTYGFAVLLVKHLYRESDIGSRYPIAPESKRHKVARFAILNPQLSIDEVARRCETTAKQVARNCDADLALREFKRLKSEP